MKYPFIYFLMFGAILLVLTGSCKRKPSRDEVKNVPAKEMNAYVQEVIEGMLDDTEEKTGKADDSTKLYALPVLNFYYASNKYKPVWSNSEKWKGHSDSLLAYLQQCEHDGLFKEDYQFSTLYSLHQTLIKDSVKRKDAWMWARADVLMTDAFMHMIQDLKHGRIQADSLDWKYIPAKHEQFFTSWLNKINAGTSMSSVVKALQPSLEKYQALKNSIPSFLDSMDRKKYTYLVYPYKDSADFVKKLLQRLSESGWSEATVDMPDSIQLRQLISNYQVQKKLKPTGKISTAMVNMLNNTDEVKFKRIAVTLDRYKQLPEQLPEKYVWVNLPSYYLQVWDNDTVAFESKTIIGKPNTPTPDISSEISNLVIYPTWTVPNSIIVKEILPGLKKNTGYLAKKGLALYTYKGDMVDPSSVDWTKYTKGIPFLVRQNSGDNNALGVIKFNFKNPYDVYLHDTNQRYLFKNKNRSLSHGCVRVQDWQKLANYIIRNDSINAPQPKLYKTNTDSIMRWISQKQLHRVDVKQRLPLFIRYFSCEGINGSIKFYEDVYNEDKAMIEKYFALK